MFMRSKKPKRMSCKMKAQSPHLIALFFLLFCLARKAPGAATDNEEQKCNDFCIPSQESINKLLLCTNYAQGIANTPNKNCCTSVKEMRDDYPTFWCIFLSDTRETSNLGMKEERLLRLPSACSLKNDINCTGYTIPLSGTPPLPPSQHIVPSQPPSSPPASQPIVPSQPPSSPPASQPIVPSQPPSSPPTSQPIVPSGVPGSGSKNSVGLHIGIVLGAAGIVGVFLGCLVFAIIKKRRHFSSNSMVWWNRDTKNDHFKTEEIIKSYGLMSPKRYTYSNLKKITNSFKEKVGQGGYGAVYKGKLPDGRMVAVKILSASKGNGEEFINEVISISRTSHVNIVSLIGFCYERPKRALIYEFMHNGSLDRFIGDKGSPITNCHLDSKTMFQIAIGIARGLEYLHRGCNTRILHFDIKPHNILLDEDLHPKISDFGLAKLCKTKESIVSMTGMRGTAGYIAPEVFNRYFGGVSHKSDVYSYGMLVLEMVGTRKKFDSRLSQTSETYFPHGIYKKLEQGETFVTLENITDDEEDTIKKMIIVSLWCIQTSPSDRPSMGKAIEMLECSLQSLQVPPKPVMHSPVKSPKDSSTTSQSQNPTC